MTRFANCTRTKVRESNTSPKDAQDAQIHLRAFERRRTGTATLFALETGYCLKPRFPLVVGLRTGHRMLWMSFLVSFEDDDWWRAVWIRCGPGHRVDRRPCAALRFLSAHWTSRNVFRLCPSAHGAVIYCFLNNHPTTSISFCIGRHSPPGGAISIPVWSA